jgi:dynein heavy chain
MPTLDSMKKLWIHEVLRVFGDRLVELNDMNWLVRELRASLIDKMETDLDELFDNLKTDKDIPVRVERM